MNKRLVYVFDVELPSSMAGAVNVTKCCAAFAAEGFRVTLVHFRGSGDIFRHYGLSRRFGLFGLPIRKRWRGSILPLTWIAAGFARLTGAIVYARKAPLLLPAARLGCPVALELHAMLGPDGHRWEGAFAELLATKRLRRIICISQALLERIAGDWPEATGLLLVAHDAADPVPEVRPRRSRRERPLLGYAGHLYPGKGMEIIAALAERRADWDFFVVGGRPDDVGRWRNSTRRLSNLEFAGQVPHRAVGGRLAEADILLAPYGRTVTVSDDRTDVSQWMSPLKLFEYMALARPIVASDLPVLREILRDGENSRLAQPDDPQDWERVIDELLDDPDAAAEMATRAREDVERKYNWRSRARLIGNAISSSKAGDRRHLPAS